MRYLDDDRPSITTSPSPFPSMVRLISASLPMGAIATAPPVAEFVRLTWLTAAPPTPVAATMSLPRLSVSPGCPVTVCKRMLLVRTALVPVIWPSQVILQTPAPLLPIARDVLLPSITSTNRATPVYSTFGVTIFVAHVGVTSASSCCVTLDAATHASGSVPSPPPPRT